MCWAVASSLAFPARATVTVAGIGTDSLTDSMWASRTNLPGSFAGIYDATLGGFLVSASDNAAFGPYDLISAFGPQSGLDAYNNGTVFPTSLGSFRISSISGIQPSPAALSSRLGTGVFHS